MTFHECCGARTRCIDSRPMKGGRRRMYRCAVCGQKWVTIELPTKPESRHRRVIDREVVGLPTLTPGQRKAVEALIREFQKVGSEVGA